MHARKHIAFMLLPGFYHRREKLEMVGSIGKTTSMSVAGSAKKNRKRTDSKVMELGSSLKLNVGAPPPCEPGSMEWMRREKEAAEAEAAAAAGGGKKGPPGKLAGRGPPGLAGMLGGGGESTAARCLPASLAGVPPWLLPLCILTCCTLRSLPTKHYSAGGAG